MGNAIKGSVSIGDRFPGRKGKNLNIAQAWIIKRDAFTPCAANPPAALKQQPRQHPAGKPEAENKRRSMMLFSHGIETRRLLRRGKRGHCMMRQFGVTIADGQRSEIHS